MHLVFRPSTLHIMSISILIAGVVIGLEATLVTVSEDVGMRELCASVMSGMLMRDVLVDVAYQDRNAMSKFIAS